MPTGKQGMGTAMRFGSVGQRRAAVLPGAVSGVA